MDFEQTAKRFSTDNRKRASQLTASARKEIRLSRLMSGIDAAGTRLAAKEKFQQARRLRKAAAQVSNALCIVEKRCRSVIAFPVGTLSR